MKTIDCESTRLILFHKHPVSARMHFICFKHGSICATKPLPKLASLIEHNATKEADLVIHPSVIASWGEKQLGLEPGVLQTEPEFYQRVEVPGNEIAVYLAGFKGNETPDAAVSQLEGKMLSLMQCVGIAPVEMLLLRKAYGVIMGGQS